MEIAVNDENVPTSSEPQEQKTVKKNRRRSSIGTELMASFFKEAELERITTPEHVIRRNRRAAAVRADNRNKVLSNIPQRLSMDIGEQPTIKSCLSQKSTSQRAAEKLLKKYRRSRSLSNTPHRPSLRFNSICTVRVITPRPQYDPDNLCLPSDDEDSKRSDRERLSTVKLEITPQSQAYLNAIKDQDNVKVEFHTQMIFGDGSKGEPISNLAPQSSDSKKRKRRKSLIVNAASPLKTPPSKLELNKKEDKKSAKSCSRVLDLDDKKTRKRSGILKNVEVEKDDEVEKEKEGRKSRMVQTVEQKKKIPEEKIEKRGRRKSGLVAPEIENPAKRKADFFAPRQLTVKEDEVKIIDPPPTTAPAQTHSNRRRSMRFITEPVVVQPSTSSSSSQKVVVEPIVLPPAAAPKKMFSLFSPRPSLKAPPPPTTKEPESEVDEVKEEKPANISVSSTTSLSSTGIQRGKLWGDRIAKNYCYLEMPPPRQTIEEDDLKQKNWLTRITQPTCSDSESEDFEFRMRECSEEKNEVIPVNREYSKGRRDKDHTLDEYLEEIKEFGAPSFKPQKFEELVEGSEDAVQVRIWLKKWKKRVRKEAKKQELAETKKKGRKSKKTRDSSDDDDSDYDASDEEELQNPLILKGPIGVGKSAFIAALAAEENMRIIGMGPDEERKGTSIKMKLNEAIRSHRVNTEPAGSLVRLFSTQKAVFMSKSKSQSEKKSIHDKGFQLSLVVFEHVDLLFGALDRNATTALIEMVNTSMVPIVWTCDEEYPMSTPMNELERAPLIVSLKRKKSKVRKYCQSLVHLATGVWIEDEVMKLLASSMDYDMRGLINQAHFYALNDKIPLPRTDRFLVSNGFQSNWNIDKTNEVEHVQSALKWDQIESKVDQYREMMRCVPDGFLKIDLPGAQVLVDDRKLLKKKSDAWQHIESATAAFHGRHSRSSMNLEMLSFLMEMDKSEQEERAKSRRYQHAFTKTMNSEYPIDDDKLIKALAAIRSSFKFQSG